VARRAAVASLDPTRHQVIDIASPAFGTGGYLLARLREVPLEKAFCVLDISLLGSRRTDANPKSSSERGIGAGHKGGITSSTSWTPLQMTYLRLSLRAPSATS
jgi:hypothetical protein